MDARSILKDIRLVPVVVVDDVDKAVALASVLYNNGIRAMEITLRTERAVDCIAAVAQEVPSILVGAGSIRRPEQIEQVKNAGARFGVSPGATPSLLTAAEDWPFVPGAETASEILALLEAGYTLQKFFPAELNGGLARINALTAPIPDVSFFPTGGINAELAREYLAHSHVQCIGGSWFVPGDALTAGDFETIGRATANAAQAIS